MSRFLIIVSLVLCIGCGEGGSREDRGQRRKRRDRGEDKKVVDDVVIKKFEGFGDMQAKQIQGRAAMMRDMAAGARDGTFKTVWDINKKYQEVETQSKVGFNAYISEQIGKLADEKDNLKPDAANGFEKYATEFESLLK